MADLIKIKGGSGNVPTLQDRELAYKKGEKALYIGTDSENVRLCGAGDVAEINARTDLINADLSSRINLINAEINNHKSNLNSISTEINSIKSEISSIKGEITKINGNIATINSRLDALTPSE